MKRADLQLETLTCPSCQQKIEAGLKRLDGVDGDSLKIRFSASKVRLNFDENIVSIEEIEKAVNSLGYQIENTRVRDA